MDYNLLGEKIKKERLKKGLTQEALAEKANVSVSFMGQIERGERKLSLETFVKISKVLGVSLDYLIQTSNRGRQDAELDELIYMLKGRTRQEITMVTEVIETIFKHHKAK